jgi:peptidoglycan hydrolase-like protein with peptidoglycan-binding domain
MYAEFLNEASVILSNSGLKDASALFRKSEAEWTTLLDVLLPDDVPAFKQVKDLKHRKDDLYVAQGGDATDEIRAINAQLIALRDDADNSFPLDEAQVTAYREQLAEQILTIHDAERDAIACLQTVMG